MSDISISLPDGAIKTVPKGTTSLEVAESIGSGLARACIAAKLSGKLIDLRSPLNESGELRLLTSRDDEAEEVIRHSAEHVMAEAVQRLFPEAKVDVGRTDHSEKFQYDFRVSKPFTEEDLIAIEKEANSILREKSDFSRQEISREEAVAFFREKNEELKVDRIKDIPEGEVIALYSHGNFTDLCRGPHVQNAKQIGVIKILDSSSVYLRGDEANEVLQRIYGTAFSSKEKLKQYLDQLEEIKKRDHRRIGKQLDLFSVSDAVGPGLILWHPKGALIRHLMESFWKEEHLKAGYAFVGSPHLAKKDLWDTSGHTEFYQENMFSGMDVDGQQYIAKPMNCPFHVQIFKSRLRSYRDLPVRLAELGTVYRYERSGVLHGLLRVRGFTQDDAHLFVTPDKLEAEITDVLQFIKHIFKSFGFTEYQMYLSTRPEKSVGSDDDWKHATASLKNALDASGSPYEEDPGEGVFYGPKIDIKIKDALGRSWQCSTIQVDFNLPKRFEIEYIDADGKKQSPIMIHRALLGSIERFFGCLVEHYAGAFPLWLAPVQVKVIPIVSDLKVPAENIKKKLMEEGFRVELDDRSEKLGFKIREGQLEKVPYILILGEKEAESGKVSVRKRGGEQLEFNGLAEFVERLKKEEAEKTQ